MKKTLLVHLHLYYIDQLDYFIEKLSNIQSVSYDLYITMVEKNDAVEQKILSHFPNANILIVPNKGYDVGPFIHVLNNVDIDSYDYVLKIHTKNKNYKRRVVINGAFISTESWIPFLVESLIGTKTQFIKNIEYLKNHSNCGMIGSKYLTTSSTATYQNLLSQINDTIQNLGFIVLDKLTFVAGTMFMMRSSLLKPIIKAGYNIDSFESTGKTCGQEGLPHVFERIFGALVTLQNHEIKKEKYASFKTLCTFYYKRLEQSFFSTKITNKGYKNIKIFRITVFKYKIGDNFIKKLFYKRKGSTKKYKLFGLTLVKISKKPTKKIIKILGIKFTKKIKKKKQKLIFSPELKNCTKLFDNNKSFKRLAVFASFNKDGLILDYVVYYLKELKKVVDGIIFVTDNPILPTELEKIKDFIVYTECQRHEEYDFGSYKRGFFWAKENGLLKDCEELVFCNDSCYGPVYPFSEMFEEMATRSCDFWGMTQNIEIAEHIQSYFLVFKKNIFKSRYFIKFMKKIKPQRSVQKVVKKYEIGLNNLLIKHGFVSDSFVKYDITNDYPYIFHVNPILFPIFLLKNKAPLIKVKAITKDNYSFDGINALIEYVKNKNKHVYELLKEYYVNIDKNIKFSLIMPTYNRKELISKSVNSVLNQSYQNFELIIIDDGSTDGTDEFIKSTYSKELQNGKIKYIYKENEGVCKARNIGLKNAQYDWIGYVDSDNMVYPNYLEIFAKEISQNKNKIYYSKLQTMLSKNELGDYFSFEKIIRGNYIDLGTFIHHKCIYEELGGFDENMTRLVDWDLILTYTKKYEPYFITLPTLLYNDLNDHQRISNSVNYEKNSEYIRKKHCSFTVSTIITTYNHEKYIAQAIESAIKQQGYFNHEILISDDASTDNSRAIIKEYVKKYPNLIKDISSEKNLGISENMKKCFQQATGKYIAVLEGDDYWEDKYKLHKQAYFLESNQDCSMVFNRIKILDADTQKFSLVKRQNNLPTKLTGEDFIKERSLIINFSCCLFISSHIKILPRNIYKYRLSEISLAFYLEQKGYIGFINQPLSIYRKHNNGVWNGASENDQKAQAKKILQTCLSVCSPKYKKDIQEIIDKKYNN